MPDRTLDVSGYACPIPILKAKKALGEMAAGATLEVLATDPAAPNDFVAFCKASGNALLSNDVEGSVYRIVIQRA